MNVARLTDGLLTAPQTMALVGLIGQTRDGRAKEHVLRDIAALYPATKAKAYNTLSLLERLEFIVVSGPNICWANAAGTTETAFRVQLSHAIASACVKELTLSKVTGCIRRIGDREGLWLDSKLLPAASQGLPYWLIEFGIASRDKTTSRLWRVSASYESIFLAAVRRANAQTSRRGTSLDELKEQLLQNEQYGQEAEQWVLAFERKRLARHPLRDQIRAISDEDASAGFDILSFTSETSLQHDLFIEVKSLGRLRRFFWTQNEVAAARILGESYALYLVDRADLARGNYQPQIITGPFSALFETREHSWDYSPSVFEFRSTDP